MTTLTQFKIQGSFHKIRAMNKINKIQKCFNV